MKANKSTVELASVSESQSKRSANSSISYNEEKSQINNKKEQDSEKMYLDVELFLRGEDENSFDEGNFNLDKNSHKFLRNAFEIKDSVKREWENKFIEIAKEEKIAENDDQFHQLINEKKIQSKRNADNFRYSFNTNVEDLSEGLGLEHTTYFTKFLITINLIFRISFIYKYSYDIGFKKGFFTVYRILVLQLFNFDKQETLFSIDNITNQICFFLLVFLWLTVFIIFYCMVRQSTIKRIVDVENSKINYEFVGYSNCKKGVFNFMLMLFVYLYIPIVRDSIMTIFFIVEQVKKDSNFSIFFQGSDDKNSILWIKFILCCVVALAFFIVPFFIYKLINNNYPLINPFDEINDTMFHSVKCPKECSGALLDIDKRMCWDFIHDNLFFVDLNRPINKLNHESKKKKVLLKYFRECHNIQSPLMILYKGFTFEKKDYLFWFLMKHYVFILLIKLPYSTLFPNFEEENMKKRSLISYALTILVCFWNVVCNIKNFNKKFNFKHDMILCLIVDIFILFIAILDISKVSVVGEYLFSSFQDSTDKNSILTIFEAVAFSFLMICVLVLIIFMIYSIPQVRERIVKKKLVIPWEWLDSSITEQEVKHAIIDFIWKPFWDNIFKDDKILNSDIEINEHWFIQNYLGGKRMDNLSRKDLAMSANNRLKLLKRRLVKSDEEDLEDDLNELENLKMNDMNFDEFTENSRNHEKLTISDLLLRKYLQFKLEGVDVFWDGNIVGKRTCLNYFGRLIISEYPFKLLMIYDETNEKVEIPQTEWINLAKLNLLNQEVIRQVKIRDQLRCLNNKEVRYDEFYFDKNKNKFVIDEDEKLLSPMRRISNRRKLSRRVSLMNIGSKENNKNTKIAKTEKAKKVQVNKEEDVKIGTLKVESIIPDNPQTHGFKLSLEVKDPKKSGKIKEVINFDANDICLNSRNFRYSKLNILLTMNDDLIEEEQLQLLKQRKENYRDEMCYRRYINEITLSSLFYNMVYNNQDVSLIEVFKYFIKYEKLNQTKLFPFFHVTGLIRAINLWELCLTNPLQSLWYIFFYLLWTKNKKMLTELKAARYFDPDSSLSICYYVFDRQKLDSFLCKLDLQHLITKEVVDKLLIKIQELREIEMKTMEVKLKNGHTKGLINNANSEQNVALDVKNSKQKKKVKFGKKKENETPKDIMASQVNHSNLNNKSNSPMLNMEAQIPGVDDEKLEYFLSRYQPYRDKFMEVVLEYSPCNYVTPSWIYLTYNNENDTQKLNSEVFDELREIINHYFSSQMKNPSKLFRKLGEYSMYITIYNDTEIFELYETKNLNCEDPPLAQFLLDKENKGPISEIKRVESKKGNFLTTQDWGSKMVEVHLPPIYRYIDDKFNKELDSHFYQQKIDEKGRIFYVDQKTRSTTFLHPMMRKRDKTRLENEMELLHGKLPDGFEVINYKSKKTGEVKLLYVDHKTKKTSWIDPRRRKKLNE